MRAIYNYLQAVAPYAIHPIVRAVRGERNLIKQLLDFGVQTLLIPMVDTPEQAEALVQAMRYPPEGIRGMGSSIARAARWNNIPDYVAKANAQTCLLVQAESTLALENLDGILEVDGIDGVFIGPSDLSASMGHVGNAAHPEVAAAIDDTIKRIAQAGKAAGTLRVGVGQGDDDARHAAVDEADAAGGVPVRAQPAGLKRDIGRPAARIRARHCERAFFRMGAPARGGRCLANHLSVRIQDHTPHRGVLPGLAMMGARQAQGPAHMAAILAPAHGQAGRSVARAASR